MVKQSQITTKMIRAWCREHYGLEWWKAPIDVRKFRKNNARVQITKERRLAVRSSTSESNPQHE
jgi:hypothetical protein